MSLPTGVLNMSVGQIRAMLEEYQAYLDGSVDGIMNQVGAVCQKALADTNEPLQTIGKIAGIDPMSLRKLKDGKVGAGVGLKAAAKLLTHLGYDVTVTATKR